MSKPKVNIAMIGCGFMGRAHSNGLNKVRSFFDLPVEPVKKVLCCRNAETGARLAERFGWPELAIDWQEVVKRPDVDVVDIATPVHTHAEIALAALRAGKAVICEKPLASNLSEALSLAEVSEQTGLPSMCMFNLRAIPAVSLAHELIREGAVGSVHQWRSTFQQGHLVNPNFPLVWRLRKDAAGSGALGDIGSHSIDMALLLVGRITDVCGMLHTYTKERWIPVKDMGRDSIPSDKKGNVTVDDAAWSLLRFENGARGSLEATRMATGRLMANQFEVYGSQGGLAFSFSRMNELEFFSLNDSARVRGWRTINVTDPVHPYMKAWWPAGHPIGYEHTFVHAYANFFTAYGKGKPAEPSFREAARVQAVVDAIEKTNLTQAWTKVEEV
jgi:predicted dehydrogenase